MKQFKEMCYHLWVSQNFLIIFIYEIQYLISVQNFPQKNFTGKKLLF